MQILKSFTGWEERLTMVTPLQQSLQEWEENCATRTYCTFISELLFHS